MLSDKDSMLGTRTPCLGDELHAWDKELHAWDKDSMLGTSTPCLEQGLHAWDINSMIGTRTPCFGHGALSLRDGNQCFGHKMWDTELNYIVTNVIIFVTNVWLSINRLKATNEESSYLITTTWIIYTFTLINFRYLLIIKFSGT